MQFFREDEAPITWSSSAALKGGQLHKVSPEEVRAEMQRRPKGLSEAELVELSHKMTTALIRAEKAVKARAKNPAGSGFGR